MPEYVGTLAFNERHYRKIEFSAPDDAAARKILLECFQEGRFESTDGDDYGEADVYEPVMWLDRYVDGSSRREEVIEELLVLGVLYHKEAAASVKKVAALSKEGACDDAAATLERLIREACALAGAGGA